jgi:Beta xylosidase C-terminal Concanavalin A-like domain
MTKTEMRTLVFCDDTWPPAAIFRRGLEPLGEVSFNFEFLGSGSKWSAEMTEHFPLVVLARANTSYSTADYPGLTAPRGKHLRFTGAMIGLRAQDLGGTREIADFDYFDYHPTQA